VKTALSVDGIRIAVEVYIPETGTAPFPSVIVCHGIPSGRPVQGGDPGYRPLARKFAEAGLLTVLFNFRGCGESGGNIDLGGWPRDLSAVLDLLEGREDVDAKKISLLGFSGGAAVSCITAASRRVAAVALAACPAEFTFLFPREGLTEMIARAREIGAIRDREFPEDPWKWLEGFYGIRPEYYIEKINAPVLIIHGTADDVVPVSHAHLLYSLAAEPKELVLLEGAGHRLRQETAAVEAALNWLLQLNLL
jgi:dipeptidyl aminopeptidase/acylaminoacyl peptidase